VTAASVPPTALAGNAIFQRQLSLPMVTPARRGQLGRGEAARPYRLGFTERDAP
jgi:hypothetical protein